MPSDDRAHGVGFPLWDTKSGEFGKWRLACECPLIGVMSARELPSKSAIYKESNFRWPPLGQW